MIGCGVCIADAAAFGMDDFAGFTRAKSPRVKRAFAGGLRRLV